jgi:hypothetical protein
MNAARLRLLIRGLANITNLLHSQDKPSSFCLLIYCTSLFGPTFFDSQLRFPERKVILRKKGKK